MMSSSRRPVRVLGAGVDLSRPSSGARSVVAKQAPERNVRSPSPSILSRPSSGARSVVAKQQPDWEPSNWGPERNVRSPSPSILGRPSSGARSIGHREPLITTVNNPPPPPPPPPRPMTSTSSRRTPFARPVSSGPLPPLHRDAIWVLTRHELYGRTAMESTQSVEHRLLTDAMAVLPETVVRIITRLPPPVPPQKVVAVTTMATSDLQSWVLAKRTGALFQEERRLRSAILDTYGVLCIYFLGRRNQILLSVSEEVTRRAIAVPGETTPRNALRKVYKAETFLISKTLPRLQRRGFEGLLLFQRARAARRDLKQQLLVTESHARVAQAQAETTKWLVLIKALKDADLALWLRARRRQRLEDEEVRLRNELSAKEVSMADLIRTMSGEMLARGRLVRAEYAQRVSMVVY